MTAIEQFQGQSLMAQADMLAKSNLVPKAFRGKSADILVATLWGGEIGLGPISSMNYIDVIEGSPTLNAEGTNALIRRAGHSVVIDANDQRCIIKGKRRDTGDEQTVTWTMDMARRAGLAGKQVWKAYPEAMLFSRAIKQIARSLFPDVQMGMSYAPEEVASFAAPELLDTQPEALARGAAPQAELPAAAQQAIVLSNSLADTRIDPRTGEIMDEAAWDAAGEIIDVTSEGDVRAAGHKPIPAQPSIVAAGQRATEQRHRYDPPTKPTSADNTRKIMAEFAEADAVKALHERVKNIDAFVLDDLRDQWKAAALPNITRKDAKLTADELKLATTLVSAAEKKAEVA